MLESENHLERDLENEVNLGYRVQRDCMQGPE